MRRLIVILGTLAIVLAMAAPAAAAPPVKESGSYQYASAWSSTCDQQGGGQTTCTESYLDAFTGPDYADVCVYIVSYAFSTRGPGRLISEVSGCSPANGFSVAGDLASASVGSTTIPVYSCGRRSCTDAGTVDVSASWLAVGTVNTYSGRSTYTEGTCTYRQTFSGASAEAAASVTIDGTSSDAYGWMSREEYTVTVRCR
jgi:hypothetical protein